jgi:DNA repair protein RadC
MRTRRTKNQIEKDKYNSEVDAYNWYVVNLDTKRAETGFEFREDAVDLLNDYDDKKKYKVVSKKALKSMGIDNPNESFKYEYGGDFQAGVYADGGYFDGIIPKVNTYMSNYAKGGSLEAHGIEVGDTFVKTISGGIQKVKDKNGKIVYIDLSTGERDAQPPLPFAMGGYTDLSKEKPEVMNESKSEKEDAEILEAIDMLQSLLNDSSKKDKEEIISGNSIYEDEDEVPEIDIEKIRTIDLDIKDNKILSLDDSIRVLKQIYDKGSINAYEEVKILFLDNSNKVIGIYNHSKGGITGTVIDVEMVCSLAVKCLAKGVIMSHNHPSGSLKFSDADIKVTRELKNALNLFRIALLDSIVITDNGYQSMTTQGILANGGSLSRFDNGGKLIGNQKSIDLNHNGKIDAEDFKLLRSTMNGAWRNEHEHVNSTSRKNGKVIEYEVRYARKNNPSRKGYKGKTNYATGGGVDDNEIQFINYKDEEIMYEPNYSEYFVNDEQFMSLEEAKDYIDKGSRMSNKTINAYRKGAFDYGGDLGMGISTKFKNYVSNHTISESFLYNNRMLSSREITPQQYELNRDYVLARRSERGFAKGGGLNRSLIEGTSGRWVANLPHAKYKLTKEVTNAQVSGKNNVTYTNIVLPKGSIVHNLSGGVFVENEKLKEEFPTIYNSKYGLRIYKMEETLNEIYNNSEILEYANGGKVKANQKMATGGETKKGAKGGIMVLAKQIRKNGESWQDALKRAGQQLK